MFTDAYQKKNSGYGRTLLPLDTNILMFYIYILCIHITFFETFNNINLNHSNHGLDWR